MFQMVSLLGPPVAIRIYMVSINRPRKTTAPL